MRNHSPEKKKNAFEYQYLHTFLETFGLMVESPLLRKAGLKGPYIGVLGRGRAFFSFLFPFFMHPPHGKIYIAFTILIIFKFTIQWHYAHHIVLQPLLTTTHLQKLFTLAPQSPVPQPMGATIVLCVYEFDSSSFLI